MIVTAAMAYYDDDLAIVKRAIQSLQVVADALVLVDGRYEQYEAGGPVNSPQFHIDIIDRYCDELGIQLWVHRPDRPWRGQCEKRTKLLQLASEGSDWVVNMDADHIFHGVRTAVRHELEEVEAQAVQVPFYTPINYDRPIADSASTQWHSNMAGKTVHIPTFFRANPTYLVERYHWWYSAELNGRRHWIQAGDGSYPEAKIATMSAPFFVEHACLFRQERHILSNREFCETRDAAVSRQGFEDAVAA